MNISNAAVDVARTAIMNALGGPYMTHEQIAQSVLAAAAPYLKVEAWDEGHESGFWNGRESAGSGEMPLVGAEHAKANNPYRSAGAGE